MPYWHANQGQKGGLSQPQLHTNIDDPFASFDKKLENLGNVPRAVSMKDPQLLPPKDYCPRFSPMSLLDGTKYCYGCNKPSDETEERTQSQLSCDSCGKVFFDKEHTNTNSSSRVIPGRPTFYGPNSMDPLHAFETANQATDPRRIIEENGPSLVADDEIGNDSSGRMHMNLSRPCAQLSSSNYLYGVVLPQVSDSGYEPPSYQHYVNTASSTAGSSSAFTPSPEADTLTQETEEHEVHTPKMVSKAPKRTCQPRTSECEVSKFHRFMDLTLELRRSIYAFALHTGRPIKPHLCDYPAHDTIQFHDDNQLDHFATNDLLGITRVNKETRAEALPIFYSANTFEVGPDTTTYFDRLAYLGRFDMIRHVRFSIEMRKESTSPGLLRRMHQYIKEADAFEKGLAQPPGRRLWSLTRHPQYTYGGIPELNTLIALMKLTSPLADKDQGRSKENTASRSKLVVPVLSASAMASFDRLKWFTAVMYGLGIQIPYVENMPFSSVPGSTVDITWHQRFQKKDFGDVPEYINPVDSTGQTAAYKRAVELDPELEEKSRPRGWAYMRTTCVGGNSGWFDITTEGGGIGYGPR